MLPNGTNPPSPTLAKIDAALRLDALVETIEVRELRDVTLNPRDVTADGSYSLCKLLLAPAGNEDVGTFTGEELCRGDADTLGTSGDDSHFPLQFTHGSLSLRVHLRCWQM